MVIALRSSTFRIAALALGLIGFSATAVLYSSYPLPIGVGVLFGAGGWIIDWRTNFRHLKGQLSAWALVVGGLIVQLDWIKSYVPFSAGSLSPWPSGIQYVSVVLMCWGALMFIFPNRARDPQS